MRERKPGLGHASISPHAGGIGVLLSELKTVIGILSEKVRLFHRNQIVSAQSI
jgi:hypothetical protein